jgi:hypothetical protein
MNQSQSNRHALRWRQIQHSRTNFVGAGVARIACGANTSILFIGVE